MKKKFVFVLLVILLMQIIFPVSAIQVAAMEVSAPSATLIDSMSGKALYEKEANAVRPSASLTKIMTLCLVFEAIEEGKLSFDQMLAASAHAAGMGGSDIWLETGETMSVHDLIKATVVVSANDAAVVLAEAVSGSEDAFVAAMNEKAKALGMTKTVFKNCNGLDEDGHVTTAHDVALMARELMKYEKITEYTLIWIDSLRDGKTQLVNTNKLIKSYSGILGLKTGTTKQAGSCMVAVAERDGMRLISVVLGAPSSNERFSDAAKLLDHGFNGWKKVLPELPDIGVVSVKGGMLDEVKAVADAAPEFMIPAGEVGEVETKVEIAEELSAPVMRGDIIGKVIYRFNGKVLGESNIRSAELVETITFMSSLRYLISQFITL